MLQDALRNKGTSFTEEERISLGLRGFLPAAVEALDTQLLRELEAVRARSTPLEKYLHLSELQDRNEALFFRLLIDNITELMPIVYTPVVGEACTRFSHIYRRPRGLFLSYKDRGSIADILKAWPRDDVYAIVVTDGERILGLGDLGANGMGIPIGKLALYVACAGLDPARVLPVTLDVGTETASVREDPLYVGLRQRRVRGPEYDAFVDEFVAAALGRWGRSLLLQFEDFGNHTAFEVLQRWRERACCFNDDIQGTAAVALGGLMAAARSTGVSLASRTYLFMGAGEAGTGIANLIAYAISQETGCSLDEARQRIWLVDSKGLVVASRLSKLSPHKRPFAHEGEPCSDLLHAVQRLRPSVLVGVCAVPGVFDEPVCRAVAEAHEHPLIFALSNPTSKAECTAEQAYRWTGGRAVFASGSPFDPVEIDCRTLRPGQGNNAYVFPGIGLGALAAGASHLSDHIFFVAARALSKEASADDLGEGCLYPPLTSIRDVSARIAVAVATELYESGAATVSPRPADMAAHIKSLMYDPTFKPVSAL